MNILKSNFVICIFTLATLGLSGCSAFSKNALQDESCQCYWMENYSGQYNWVAAESVRGTDRKTTKAECYKLDSCDGGLGHSNGGCYKWAMGPENTRIPW